MEQSRISPQQPSQTTHASRPKKADKPAADAAQDATAGGFVALMAALGDGLAADGTADLSDADPLALSAKDASDLVDPYAGNGPQSLLTANMLAAGFDKTMLKGAPASGSTDVQVGSSNLMWAHDPVGGGLVTQTAALDGMGDVKDGDAAAALLTQGRPPHSRLGSAMGQRGETLAQATAGLVKGVAGDVSKAGVPAADISGISGALTSLQTSSVRESMQFQSTFAREQSGRAEFAGALPSGMPSEALGGMGEIAPVRGGSAADLGSDASGAGYSGERAWGASIPEAPGGGLQDVGLQDASVFASTDEALAEQVTYWVNQKTQNAEVTLSHDGKPVEVSVTLSGNEAHVSFRSDQAHTRQMLDGNMAQLSDMLRDQGLMLSGSSVGTSGQEGRGSSKEQTSSERNPSMRQAKVEVANTTAVRHPSASAGNRSLDIFV